MTFLRTMCHSKIADCQWHELEKRWFLDGCLKSLGDDWSECKDLIGILPTFYTLPIQRLQCQRLFQVVLLVQHQFPEKSTDCPIFLEAFLSLAIIVVRFKKHKSFLPKQPPSPTSTRIDPLFSKKQILFASIFFWLVVSTQLKHMSQNGFIFPNFRGENKKIFETTT